MSEKENKKVSESSEESSSSAHKKIVIYLAGGLIAINALLPMVISSAKESVSKIVPKSSNQVVVRRNPAITWYEKFFCLGYRQAENCSQHARHPIVSPTYNPGNPPPGKQYKPRSDKRVVESTIVVE